jgi:hypothetical protein
LARPSARRTNGDSLQAVPRGQCTLTIMYRWCSTLLILYRNVAENATMAVVPRAHAHNYERKYASDISTAKSRTCLLKCKAWFIL